MIKELKYIILYLLTCEAGELYRAILDNKSEQDIARLVEFYDYLEIQPLGNNRFMIDSEDIPEGIDYLNAHGTATVKGDIAEACAIRAVFGDLPVTVSSTKGATGHMMGAGGLTEVITCVQAIRTGLLPPSLGLTEQDPECPLHLTGPTAVQQPVHAAISNAMGFGGQNSCIVVGRYQE